MGVRYRPYGAVLWSRVDGSGYQGDFQAASGTRVSAKRSASSLDGTTLVTVDTRTNGGSKRD